MLPGRPKISRCNGNFGQGINTASTSYQVTYHIPVFAIASHPQYDSHSVETCCIPTRSLVGSPASRYEDRAALKGYYGLYIILALFAYPTEVSRANKYIGAQPAMYSKRIRIVTASDTETGPPVSTNNVIEMLDHLEVCFNQWIDSEIRQASVTQVDGGPIGEPSLVIEDLFNGGMALECKSKYGIPVVGWWITPASSLMSITGHEQACSKTVYDSLLQLDARKEPDLFTKANELYLQNVSDRLVTIPGLPAVHEWELSPQSVPFIPPFIVYLAPRISNMLKHIDQLVFCTTFEIEPISAASISTAFKRPVTPFFIGPAVDLISPRQPDDESAINEFLDRAYSEHGAHSVIYVAFGTAFFPLPSTQPHLMAALDEIPKAGFKFVFALSSESAGVDQAWMDTHVQAGNAIFPKWANQTAVLEHPAIHYFLSHGGWNSSTEALVRGVPFIFWPFMGDQPTNAMQIANVHDCGFELLQIRTGAAQSTAYRNGTEIKILGTQDAAREEMKHILELSKGPRGEHQRANVRMLGKVVADSLGRGGSGDVGLENLGKALSLV
ncbi:UDP-glucoronosyl and UDP-glucosyl transferase, partial [Rhizoctonia solani]